MMKAIIFDCFGVLITDGLEALMQQKQVNNSDRQKIKKLTTSVNRGLLDITNYRTEVASILGISLNEYLDQLFGSEHKNIELLKYIDDLKKDYKIGMLSNVNNSDSLYKRFEKQELELFDEVVASGEIGFAKPQAQAFEIVAEKLGVRCDECIMIDDREDYCMGARASGMQTILYESLEKTMEEIKDYLL
ncbi:hypothetical protein EBZ57_02455 [bacterium]|nr:hypothetical protein [bacterium]